MFSSFLGADTSCFLRELPGNSIDSICFLAASSRHLEVLQLAKANGCPCGVEVCTLASMNKPDFAYLSEGGRLIRLSTVLPCVVDCCLNPATMLELGFRCSHHVPMFGRLSCLCDTVSAIVWASRLTHPFVDRGLIDTTETSRHPTAVRSQWV